MNGAERKRVVLGPRAERDLRRLPPLDQDRVRQSLLGLAARPMQGDIKKLQGHDHDWRLRVGDYRVRFAVDTHTDQIIVLRILPRGRAYRD